MLVNVAISCCDSGYSFMALGVEWWYDYKLKFECVG